MKKLFLVTTFFLIAGIQLFPQDFNKTILSATDPTWLYTNDGQSDTLFYLDMTPESQNGTILVLLAGWHRKIEEIFQRTSLPQEVYKNGIATLIPSVNTRVHSDTSCFAFINKMMLDYSRKENIEIKNVIIGGMSAGGIMSLNYAIYMVKNKHESIPEPKAVVTVDPPVDLYNLWFIMERLSERNCNPAAKREADYYMNYCKKFLGGTPYEIPEKYKEVSPFARKVKNGGNTYYLRNIPLRIYTEIDIEWSLNRCEDLSDLSATDQSAMVNTLRMLGNKNVDFIVSKDKGYRLDGARHPHSWSILDSKDCADWIERIVEKE